MSSKGGYAAPPRRSNSGGRFYNPPPVRRQQQMLLQQQQQMMQRQLLQQQEQQQRQLQRAEAVKPNSSAAGDVEDAEKRREGDVSSTSTALPIPPSNVTNLDRLLESVTPYIPAQNLLEVNARGQRMRDVESHSFFRLEDLWESFSEWSAFGAGVPFLLNGKHPIVQYYVPSLSGMQLYTDPSKRSSQLSGARGGNAAEFHRFLSIAGNSNPEAERKGDSVLDANMRELNGLSLGDKSVVYSSGSKTDIVNSPGLNIFQYMEYENPHYRKPLTDKISALPSDNPELNKYRSCDLLPTSWICVAWYPIYRIPIGPTLRDLNASFLTFHSLSTQSRCNFPHQFHAANTRTVHGILDPTPRISLPVFGLASYNPKHSMSPWGPQEFEQENSLWQSAHNWLQQLQVNLPDYEFFLDSDPHRRKTLTVDR